MESPGAKMLVVRGGLLLGLLCLWLGPVLAAEKPLSQGLQCDGCVAVLQELHKKLADSQGRKKVIESTLRGLCNTDNFVIYRHSPPKMMKACSFILDNYRDELTSSLQSFYKKYRVKDNLKLQAEFCDSTVKLCLPGQRDADIRMAPEGMTIEEANQKLAQDMGAMEQQTDVPTPVQTDKDEL